MKFTPSYALKESWRRKGYYIMCLMACFLVSLVTLILKTLVIQGGLIFLMLGEQQSGEIDIILTPDGVEREFNPKWVEDYYYDWGFINYTKFTQGLSNKKEEVQMLSSQSTIRTNIQGVYKTESDKPSMNLILINSTKEQMLEIGRSFPSYNLSKGECIVHQKIKQKLSRDTLLMTLDLTNFFRDTLLQFYYEDKEHYNKNITQIGKIEGQIKLDCRIKLVINDNYGKLPADNNNAVLMETKYFYQLLSEFIPNDIKELFPDYQSRIHSINPDDYSNQLIVNFPPNRVNAYIESNTDELLDKGVKYANMLMQEINSLQHSSVSMPLITQMQQFSFGLVLINIIMNIIIISLFILSLILIHSLLMMTTETNSFEYGVLRLIGSTKVDLILIIMFQCLIFALPGFLLGFGAHFIVLGVINSILKTLIKTDLAIQFDAISLLIALAVTVLAPLAAAILPIRRILRKNISNSLNTNINKTIAIKIEIVSLEKKETSSMVVFGLLTFFYGVSIYYFLPLGLISSDFGLMGSVFLFILVGIVVGLILLSMNIENILQKVIMYSILFFTRSYMKQLILKNLTAHRLQNRKTSIMYSLCVGLFIMATVSIDIVLQSVQKQNLLRKGSQVVLSSGMNYFNSSQVTYSLKKMFERGGIESFSFKTPPLRDVCTSSEYYSSTKTQIMNYGTSFAFSNDVLGISQTYFDVTEEDFLKIAEYHDNGEYKSLSLSEQMYLKENIGKIGLSAIFTWEFGLSLNEELYLKTSNSQLNKIMSIVTKPSYLLNSAPGVQMNSEASMMYQRGALFNIPMYMDLLQKCKTNFPNQVTDIIDVPYQKTYIEVIHLKPSKHKTINEAIKIISDIIYSDSSYFGSLWIYENSKNRMSNVSSMIYVVFNTVCAIVLFFCFFNLAASMTISIFEQKKEIAILRSIGMKATHIIFVFVAEAIVLILTSSVIGTLIGCIISFTMSLQWQLFLNVPLTFSLNIISLIIVIVFSIIGGILSTIGPAIRMMRYPVAVLIKR